MVLVIDSMLVTVASVTMSASYHAGFRRSKRDIAQGGLSKRANKVLTACIMT